MSHVLPVFIKMPYYMLLKTDTIWVVKNN